MDRAIEKMDTQTEARFPGRKPAIECFRLVASVLVVFIHFHFPGTFGDIMNCLARVAVPFFFVVSGYFLYRADETVVRKRMIGTFKLNVYATLLYLVWGTFRIRYIYGGSRMAWLESCFSSARLSEWILFCKNPFSTHLWYLMAIFTAYLIFYAYVRWKGKSQDHSGLYIVSVVLVCIHFLISVISEATDMDIPRMFYRNALFFGLPMVSLGMFVREYQCRIMETYGLSAGKLILLIGAGAALSVLQWRGTGEVEMPLGTLVEVLALMLLLASAPGRIPDSKVCRYLIAKAGKLSTFVYVTHLMWIDIYKQYIASHLNFLGETVSGYLGPILVVLISIACGMAWIPVKELTEKIFRQFSTGKKGSV